MDRPAREQDFERIAEITNHYIEATPIHFSSDPVDAASLRQAWAEGRSRHPWWVAERDGQVVGYAKVGPWRAREAYRFTGETGIYLDPAWLGRGVGRSLYASLLAACDEAGLHTLVAGVALPNPASLRLHEALGFRRVGVFREVGRKFDAWHDVAWFQRDPRG